MPAFSVFSDDSSRAGTFPFFGAPFVRQLLVLAEWHLDLRYEAISSQHMKSEIMTQWGRRFATAPCSRILLGSVLTS
jgi:hypothetical protein